MTVNSLFRQPTSAGALATLRNGAVELIVAPECGARIVSLRFAGRDIVRPAGPRALDKGLVYGFGGFPLMPYSGPIFSGGFAWSGGFHRLTRNVREEPTATHGEGWIRPWTIVSRSDASLELRLEYGPEPDAFPFAWRGGIVFTALADGALIDMALTCADHRPMPAGFGFHPYFPKPPGTRLRFNARAIWPADAPEAVDLPSMPIPPGLDFSGGPEVSAMVVDRCYEGWPGTAEIIAPDGAVTIVSAGGALTRLQIYSAWDEPYVCVEPVSNANDGFNRAARGVPGHGVVELAPGETLSGSLQIRQG
jgi:aldose 1-epimerase